jgi:hypothetical protein
MASAMTDGNEDYGDLRLAVLVSGSGEIQASQVLSVEKLIKTV